MKTEIPSAYRKCAVQDELNCCVTVYHSSQNKDVILEIESAGSRKVAGPFSAAELDTLTRAIRDVLEMKGNVTYIE